MDVYYLAIAYVSVLRNWTSGSAVEVARFLYFYRLGGGTAFELTDWRPLLLIFPNTFEYFFIAYEGVRTRRDPRRYAGRFWVWTAATIWVVVKLPQEWWIHIAKLDFTAQLDLHPALGPTIVVALLLAGAVFWWFIRPRLSPPAWTLRISADPLPEASASWQRRAAWTAAHETVVSTVTAEKVVLVGLISVIYGEVLPGLDTTAGRLFFGIALVVVVNAGVSIGLAKAAVGTDSAFVAFLARIVFNTIIVVTTRALVGGDHIDVRA